MNIGLSSVQLRKLLQIEGIYYSGISIVISVFGGTFISYIINSQLGFMSSGKYQPPLKAIVLVAAAFTLIQVIITYLVEKRLKKESVIDRIRYNE